MVGSAFNAFCQDKARDVLWLQVDADGKERLPLAVALVATQGNTTSASFPTTLKEAKETRWWPVV